MVTKDHMLEEWERIALESEHQKKRFYEPERHSASD
jgi:hypothetical protein